jgi:NADH-quinone oxidoreductase subunit D
MVVEREFETVDMNINMGPQHPSTHGVFRMVLTVDGELVVDLDSYIGYMHRGNEKLPENQDYRQIIGFMDRTDYLAQMSCEWAYCDAVEKLAGIEIPERAQYIRIIMAELQRVASHCMFMGAFGADVGSFGTTFTYGFRERERIQDLFEEVCGDRLMYNYIRIGGVSMDLPENFETRCRWVLSSIHRGIEDLDGLLTSNEIFLERTQEVGKISAEDAIDWGLSGPMLRASGVPLDLRIAEPYAFYDRFDWQIATGVAGDVFDRYMVRLQEMYQSAKIVEQALEQIQPGYVVAESLPKNLRLGEGEIYNRHETPRGEWGVYILSKGGNKPWRFKVRSPSFSNLQALRPMTIGSYVADAVTILGSIDIVLGDVDR